ncbi:MAG: DNA translocase FtsK 4TM domain-containing protein [Rhodocyclaceae bacterium]|nr:DNA translocase FtsK 4TM domain-containing protein [Rhodocyclaceae bacterium]
MLGVVAFYIGLILYGFSKADPGWSHAAQVERIANPGGRIGAWLADLLLYLFGLSAWWWVLFFLFLVIWGYRRLEGIFHTDRRPFFIALSGFIVLIAASAASRHCASTARKRPCRLSRAACSASRSAASFSQFLGFTGARSFSSRCLPQA